MNKDLQKLFAEVAGETLNRLREHHTVPSDYASRRRILAAMEDAREYFARTIADSGEQAARVGRNAVLSHMQHAGMRVSMTDFSMITRNTIRDHAFEASRGTMARMTGDVMDNLARSYADGLGIDEASGRLRDTFSMMQDYELRRVARTEINNLQNEGAYQTERELGVEYHMWWTAVDERRRGSHPDDVHDHVSLHGQIVKVGEPFSNGLYYPGDRSDGEATIGEWINCRCRLIPFIMPPDKRAPEASYFYERDLVNVEEDDPDPFSKEALDEQREKMKEFTRGDKISEEAMRYVEEAMTKKVRDTGGLRVEEWIKGDWSTTDHPKTFMPNALLKKITSHMGGTSLDRVKDQIRTNTDWMLQHIHPAVTRKAGSVKEILAQSGRGYYRAGNVKMIKMSGQKASTFTHEMGHHLHYNTGVRTKRAVRAFFKKRIGTEKATKIYVGKDELGFKDKFLNHYMGKSYDFDAKEGTEILSMGIEYMQTDPLWFFSHDREMFNFVLAYMKGLMM